LLEMGLGVRKLFCCANWISDIYEKDTLLYGKVNLIK